MFAGFNLDLSDNLINYIDFSNYKTHGETHLNKHRFYLERELQKYILSGKSGEVVDGTKLQDDWFPEVKADIFISHSHLDLELAQGLAGWLNQIFGLKCFIDSNVWGYADTLLEKINDAYSNKRCHNDLWVYDHQKCNTASKHVTTMLSIALQKMIDKTEATLLLNTNNSIEKYSKVYESSTYSPWIYSEIVCTEIVRKRPLSDYRESTINELRSVQKNITHFLNAEYKAQYEVSLQHLVNINTKILYNWYLRHDSACKYPLDELYVLSKPEKVAKLLESHRYMTGN